MRMTRRSVTGAALAAPVALLGWRHALAAEAALRQAALFSHGPD